MDFARPRRSSHGATSDADATPGCGRPHYSILAYGDSLTWGRIPETRKRHAPRDRWPSVLQGALGDGVEVVAEGLPGRTTMFDDSAAAVDRNGERSLPVILATHEPLDLVIVMLGSNDLKPSICGTVAGVVDGLERLVATVRGFSYQGDGRVPDVMLVSPPHFGRTTAGTGPRAGRSVDESRRLAPAIRQLSDRLGCLFFDAAEVATPSTADGVHLDATATRALGEGIALLVTHHLPAIAAASPLEVHH